MDKAISLDPNLSLAYAVRGNDFGLDYLVQGTGPQWNLSFENLAKAIENNPNNATAHHWTGINYLALGYLERALESFNACLKIDPAYGNCLRHKGITLTTMGQGEAGLDLFTEGLFSGYPPGGAGFPFFYTMAKQKDDTAALLFLRSLYDENTFPFKAVLEAIQDPEGNQGARWAQMKRWAEIQGGTEDDFNSSEKFVFGQYALIKTDEFDYSYFIWWPDAADFRKTEKFKQIASTRNYLGYWQEHGFPPGCRAVGDDDFECD